MIFVDTNYLIRFFLADVNSQHKKAVELFEDGAMEEVILFTSTIVFFEVYWVMKTFYKKDKQELIAVLSNMLEMSFIKIKESDVLQKTLNLYEKSNIELEDCYNIEHAKNNKMSDFASFDKKLMKIINHI